MTYEEAKDRLAFLRDYAKRLEDNCTNRKEYLTKTIGADAFKSDTVYCVMNALHDCTCFEISHMKKVVKSFPENDPATEQRRKMWSGLTEEEKIALQLVRIEIGGERFKQICKQAIETDMRRRKAKTQKKEEDAAREEQRFEATDRAMRSNGNTFASRDI